MVSATVGTCVGTPTRVPSKATSSVPASAAGRTVFVADRLNWKNGMSALPLSPAEKTSSSEDRTTPTAPAAAALFARATEPHANSIGHSSQTIFPATAAASPTV